MRSSYRSIGRSFFRGFFDAWSIDHVLAFRSLCSSFLALALRQTILRNLDETLAMRRKINVWDQSRTRPATPVSNQKTVDSLAKRYQKPRSEKPNKTMRANIEKTQKIAENQARNRVAMEMRMNLAKMRFRGSPKMPQKAPKASRERPGSTPEHAGNVQERPWNVPSASREHSEIRSSAPREPRSVSEVIWG